MMASKPVNTDSDGDAEILSNRNVSHSVEELLFREEELTTSQQNSSEENPSHLEPEKKDEEEQSKATVSIELPEPDADNITVLTHKLPNKPILPWNRYDSPWKENEAEAKTAAENEEKPENLSEQISEDLTGEETTIKTEQNELKVDEVDEHNQS